MKLITFVCAAFLCLPSLAQEKFPDGTPVSDWFKDSKIVDINTLGKKYILTDYGVINDSTLLQTEKIQSAIDAAAQNGGGVIVIPKGTYLSGALFFKPKTHLHLEEGAVLKGSDDISNFPIIDTRMEGQSLKYFAALVNADKVDGFTLSGKGTIDGNGLRFFLCDISCNHIECKYADNQEQVYFVVCRRIPIFAIVFVRKGHLKVTKSQKISLVN